jgi:hypothetical protein
MEILFKYNVHSILGWTDLSDLFIQFLFLWFWILFCIDCCSFLCCSPIELIKRRIWSKLSQSKSDQEFFERKFNCFTTMASQISRFKPHREHLGMYVKTGLFWKFCIYSPTIYRLCRSILFHRYYVLGHFQSVYHANPMFFDSVCHTPSICERKLFRWVRWKPIRYNFNIIVPDLQYVRRWPCSSFGKSCRRSMLRTRTLLLFYSTSSDCGLANCIVPQILYFPRQCVQISKLYSS